MTVLLPIALLAAGLAAALHVVIFVMESLLWTTPRVRAVFGIRTAEAAETTRPLALNQGFYNLFLAIVTAVGIGLLLADSSSPAGVALLIAGTGSMLAAALVLVGSDRRRARPALIQGALPAVALLALLGAAPV